MAHLPDDTSDPLQQLADARAVFRRERDADRDRLAAEREEVDRLVREAKGMHAEAARRRDRAKKLAVRYARRVRQKWADARAEVAAGRAGVGEARDRLTAEVARFEIARSEFAVSSAEAKDRLREEWAALEAQRRRAAAEWAEANDYAAKQEAALAARVADVAGRERSLAADKKAHEAETVALRAEAAGLEARVANARVAADELEQKRDRLRAELLGRLAPPDADPPGGPRVALDRRADRDLTEWAADLDARDAALAQEKARLAALRADLDRENAALDDRRRVLAEQFVMLATAQAQWQEAERGTLGEMEELATGLRDRERDLDARDDRLVRADARRREDAYELWQFRLRLEAWQSKLTAVEQRWHAERAGRDADHDGKLAALTRREAEVEDLFAKWEKARSAEGERLRGELRLWADDRARLARAADAYDRQCREVLAELTAHAARALASEEFAAEAAAEVGGDRPRRRLDVLRKRWERAFRLKLDEIDDGRAALAADRARLDERYADVHRALGEAAGRDAERNTRAARADVDRVIAAALPVAADAGPAVDAPSGPTAAELGVLRDEFERMAAVLLDAGVPDPPDADLPWASEDTAADPADVLLFPAQSRAA